MKFLAIVGATGIALASGFWIFTNLPTEKLVFALAQHLVSDSDVLTPDPESVFFLGDIMLARDVEKRLQLQQPGYAFEELSFLQDAKWVVGNFEASIPKTHIPTPDMTMRFSVTPTLLDVLKLGGVTHLSLANNHALDYFEDGYTNTVNELQTYGFEVLGHPVRVDEHSLAYFETNGRIIALIGINATYGDVPSVWADLLVEASLQSDTQIAYVHWGDEYERVHSEAQEELAHLFIDAGFEVIIGHHPHVVQDIERYRDGIIFYSLGNFIFDQYWNQDVSEGLMLELVMEEENMIFLLHPVESRTAKVKPRLMADRERSTFLEELASRSSVTLREAVSQGAVALQF